MTAPKNLLRSFLVAVFCISLFESASSQSGTESTESAVSLSGSASILTKSNFEQYMKPFFTSLGQSMNSNLFSTANHDTVFRIGVDLSWQVMWVPTEQQTFIAELPSSFSDTTKTRAAFVQDGIVYRSPSQIRQPTFFGGKPTTVYHMPQDTNSYNNLGGYAEFPGGNNFQSMVGIPTLQLMFQIPTQTHVRLRVMGTPKLGSKVPGVFLGALGIDQRINQFLGLLKNDSSFGLAVNASYSMISISNFIETTSFAVGIHTSKTFFNFLAVYGGVQYEDFFGTMTYARTPPATKINDATRISPFDEIRNQGIDPVLVKSDITTFSNLRFTVGTSIKTKFAEFHAELGVMSQLIFAFGASFWFN